MCFAHFIIQSVLLDELNKSLTRSTHHRTRRFSAAAEIQQETQRALKARAAVSCAVLLRGRGPQPCPTLCDRRSQLFSTACPALRNTMDCSRPGSSAHGIFQARMLEWAAISESRGFS